MVINPPRLKQNISLRPQSADQPAVVVIHTKSGVVSIKCDLLNSVHEILHS